MYTPLRPGASAAVASRSYTCIMLCVEVDMMGADYVVFFGPSNRAPRQQRPEKWMSFFFVFFFLCALSIYPSRRTCVIVTEIYTYTVVTSVPEQHERIKSKYRRARPECYPKDYRVTCTRLLCRTKSILYAYVQHLHVYIIVTSYRREIRSIRVPGLLRRRRQSFCTVTIRYRHNVGRDGSAAETRGYLGGMLGINRLMLFRPNRRVENRFSIFFFCSPSTVTRGFVNNSRCKFKKRHHLSVQCSFFVFDDLCHYLFLEPTKPTL